MHGAVYNVMQSRGFTQLVHQPTTDQGSVLDHVYVSMESLLKFVTHITVTMILCWFLFQSQESLN